MKKILAIILLFICFDAVAGPSDSALYQKQWLKWRMKYPFWMDNGAYLQKITQFNGDSILVAKGSNGLICFRSVSSLTPATPTFWQVTHAGDSTNVNTEFQNGITMTGGTLDVTGTFHSITATTSDITLNVPASKAIFLNAGASGEIQLNAYTTCDDELHVTQTLTVGNLASGTAADSVVVATSGGLFKKRPASAFGSGLYLPLAGGELAGNLLFTDNTYTVGDATHRPSIGYFGTSLLSPLAIIGTAQNGSAKLSLDAAITASSNYGLASFGNGAWNGSTSGFFSGAAAGTLIAGNLASGSTSDLLNLQIGGVSYLKSDNNGTLTSKGGVTANFDGGFQLSGGVGGFNKLGSGVQIESANSYTEGVQISLTQFNNFGNGYVNTSGTVSGFQNGVNFKPTSGTAVFNSTVIKPVINQTGGANGITRGLYINPTLTSAFDFRGYSLATTIAASSGAPLFKGIDLTYTINNTGTVASSIVNGIFLNATETSLTGTTHNLMDLQVGGVSKFKVDNVGNTTIKGTLTYATSYQLNGTTGNALVNQLYANSDVTATSWFEMAGKSRIYSAADGRFNLTNNGVATFTRLTFGLENTSHPALQVNGKKLVTMLGDGSATSNFQVKDTTYNSTSWDGSLDAVTKNEFRDNIELKYNITDSSKWHSQIVNLDNIKLNKTDTAAMLSPYVLESKVYSGIYTPTSSDLQNISSVSFTNCGTRYHRINSQVVVTGAATITITSSATLTSFELTLPIPSTLGSTYNDIAGVANGVESTLGGQVSTESNHAQITWGSTGLVSGTYNVTYTYSYTIN